MIVLLLTAAFLCGVPLGIIVGIIIAWRMTKPARYEEELDYSDGF